MTLPPPELVATFHSGKPYEDGAKWLCHLCTNESVGWFTYSWKNNKRMVCNFHKQEELDDFVDEVIIIER